MAPRYAKDQPEDYNNYIKNVAIVGATGTVGTYITKSLLSTNKHSITAITRQGSNSSFPSGVKVAYVDYSDSSTIVDALKGHDILIITLAVSAPPGTHDQLAKAAYDAGVPWVMPNGFGVGTGSQATLDAFIGAGQIKEHEYIESLSSSTSSLSADSQKAISWIAVVCGFWYEFSLVGSLHRYGFDVSNGKKEVTLFDNGNARMSTSSWARVGEAVAKLLSLKILPEDENDEHAATLSQWRNDTVEVESFTVSQRDMWASLRRVMGTEESEWTVKHEVAKERYDAGVVAMRSGDRNGFSRAMYTRMFYEEEPIKWTKSANKILGLEEEDLDTVTKNALMLEAEGAFSTKY